MNWSGVLRQDRLSACNIVLVLLTYLTITKWWLQHGSIYGAPCTLRVLYKCLLEAAAYKYMMKTVTSEQLVHVLIVKKLDSCSWRTLVSTPLHEYFNLYLFSFLTEHMGHCHVLLATFEKVSFIFLVVSCPGWLLCTVYGSRFADMYTELAGEQSLITR